MTEVTSPPPPAPSQPRLRQRLALGAARNLVATVFGQGSTFALNIVAAHVLGRLRFGEFTVVQGTLAMLANFGQFATGYTATKYLAEYRDRDPARASRILGLCSVVSTVTGTLVAGILLFGGPTLAARAYLAPMLAVPFMVAAPAVLFVVMNGFRSGALGGLERYDRIAEAGVVGGITYLAFGALGAWLGGVSGALAGVAISAAIQWLLLGRSLRRESIAQGVPAVYDHPWREREVLLRFALPAALSGFVTSSALWLASTLVARQPGGLEQMALFAAANTYRVVVLFLPNTIHVVVMSLLNNQARDAHATYRRLFWASLCINATLAAGTAATIAFLGPWLLGAFGRSFHEGYTTLLILMAAAVLETIAAAAYQVIQTQARLWLSLFVIALPRDLLIVIMAYVLAPRLGAAGLATGYLVAWGVAVCTTGILVMRLGIRAPASAGPLAGAAGTEPA